LDDVAAAWLLEFAKAGGVVFVEGLAGFRGADTFLRQADQRPLFAALGLQEITRGIVTIDKRSIPANALGQVHPIELHFEGYQATFASVQDRKELSIVPLEPDGAPLLAVAKFGKGRVIVLGGRIGMAMSGNALQSVEKLAPLLDALLAMADVKMDLRVQFTPGSQVPVPAEAIFTSAQLGRSGDRHMLIVTHFGQAGDVTLKFASNVVTAATLGKATEWFDHPIHASQIANETILKLTMSTHDQCVISWPV
jgi:hypothetical protein